VKKKCHKWLIKAGSSISGQLFIASLLGAIQVFAFAPFQQWWVLYPSFVGFFLLLNQVKIHHQKLFWVSFTFNISMFIATIHWIYVSMDLFGGMPSLVSASLIVLLCAYLSLFPSIALWLTYKIPTNSITIKLLLLLPSFWLMMDWFRGWFLTGFPWAYLGYSHIDTAYVGYAPILGVQGMTLAILLTCSSLTLLFLKQSQRLALGLISLLILTGYGLTKITYTTPQAAVKVALIQGNIDQNKKWQKKQLYPSLLKYLTLSDIEINRDKTSLESDMQTENELIIWPESAIAALEIDIQNFLQPLSQTLTLKNKTLLTGIINYDIEHNTYFNSIITLGKLPLGEGYSQQSPNRYHKHHLLPIGEFVPFENLLRPLAPYFNLPMSSFDRGNEVQQNIKTNQTSLVAAICYEIVFPELLRKNIHHDTGIIVTISNDAWFGDSIGPAQHLQIARMRSIEFARPLLRSTNTGISAIFDSKGKELGRLATFEEGVLRREIQPAYGKTPYQYLGQVPLFLFCLLTLILAFILIKKQHIKT
jgi:apolipoprotein N-acyltransferase